MAIIYGHVTHLPENKSNSARGVKGEPEFVFSGSTKSAGTNEAGADIVVRTSATRTVNSLAAALKAAENMSGTKGLFARVLADGRCWEVSDENPAQASIPESAPEKPTQASIPASAPEKPTKGK